MAGRTDVVMVGHVYAGKIKEEKLRGILRGIPSRNGGIISAPLVNALHHSLVGERFDKGCFDEFTEDTTIIDFAIDFFTSSWKNLGK